MAEKRSPATALAPAVVSRRTSRPPARTRATPPAEPSIDHRRDLLRDSYTASALGDVLDRAVHAAVARTTAGISPAALMLAYLDWAIHLRTSPAKQLQLWEKAVRDTMRLTHYALTCAGGGASPRPCAAPSPNDLRFSDPAWQQPPFNLIHQSFLLTQDWWRVATTGVRGVARQNEQMVSFLTRQMLDMWSPVNFPTTNPIVLERTLADGGMNLARGMQYLISDVERHAAGQGPVGIDAFMPGRTVAITPGSVVYRNRLIELIQYAPSTPKVRAEPILIVPAWIMKYYILDLSPANSLVKHLTDQGFTVFMISWKNPTAEDRDLGLDDYLELGILEALDAVDAIMPGAPVHAAGYCLGGTLLAMATAYLARANPERLQSLTMLAAQTDFHEAGELTLFINESQLAMLDDVMWEQGFLDTTQMAGAFQMLRSNDLVWSRWVRHYLLGERPPMFDLMAWNADATRMPYRMHSQYLRRLFLDNDLAEGRMTFRGVPLVLENIRQPAFAVGTVRDHVAPWKSVYKLHHQLSGDLTFVLTEGGHNAGIVVGPVGEGRSFQIMDRPDDAMSGDPQTWAATAPHQDGSWWSAWIDWLDHHSTGAVTPPRMGAIDAGYPVLGPAPGTYVLQP